MIAIIEKISPKLTRLTCLNNSEWILQKNKLSALQKAEKIQIIEVDDFDQAKALVASRRPLFKEYISSTNKFDLIIEIFEE